MDARACLIGITLAVAVAAFAALAGFDRDRSFYPTLLIVIASCYVLFAAIGAGAPIIGWETAGLFLFGVAAIIGFRRNLWIVVGALCCHGMLDAIHDRLIMNPGTPGWWPVFCLAFDVTAAACLAWRISRPGHAARSI
ncbi:MAG TPA: hypothetical protein VK533_11355 [Sphingomonas sp.]|uniref:hypothetical protein n=1 Tax=Sphingomonas sp. TaxID=28214 RepID=UPI002CD02E98|nr:hypothetical protein [Sphingomonas sp.]HMI20132.1 hypothetical protein [Sphingomonas sp.]